MRRPDIDISDISVIVGVLLVVVAMTLVHPALGLLVAGGALIAVGSGASRTAE